MNKELKEQREKKLEITLGDYMDATASIITEEGPVKDTITEHPEFMLFVVIICAELKKRLFKLEEEEK